MSVHRTRRFRGIKCLRGACDQTGKLAKAPQVSSTTVTVLLEVAKNRVLAINRGKNPSAKTESKIQVVGVLIAFGYAEGVGDLKKLASPEKTCNME